MKGYPLYLVGLLVAGNRQPIIDFNQKTDINMSMRGYFTDRRDIMHIDIENFAPNKVDIRGVDTSLLGAFLEGDLNDVRFAIGMASRLKPVPILAVVHKQHPIPFRTNNPCRPGYMDWGGAIKNFGVILDMMDSAPDIGSLVHVAGMVALQERKEIIAMHGQVLDGF